MNAKAQDHTVSWQSLQGSQSWRNVRKDLSGLMVQSHLYCNTWPWTCFWQHYIATVGEQTEKSGSEPEKLWKYETITKLKDSGLGRGVTEICAANKGHNLQETQRIQKNSMQSKERIAYAYTMVGQPNFLPYKLPSVGTIFFAAWLNI